MENEQQDPAKVKRYNRLAVIFSFLLALLWPIGSYFFWILGGAIAYFLFLAWFYSPRKRDDSSSRQTKANFTASDARHTVQNRVRLRLIIWLVVGSFIFLLIFMIIGIMNNNSASLEGEAEQMESTSVNINSVDAVITRGNEFYDQGQYDSAMVYYNKALQIEPENQYALYDKALIYYSKNDYRSSMKILRNVLHNHSDYGYAHYLMGDIYQVTNRVDSALYYFEKAYQYEVRDAGLLQNMGDAYKEQGNIDIAIKYYKEALGQDSTLVDVYKTLADLDRENQTWYRQQAKKYE